MKTLMPIKRTQTAMSIAVAVLIVLLLVHAALQKDYQDTILKSRASVIEKGEYTLKEHKINHPVQENSGDEAILPHIDIEFKIPPSSKDNLNLMFAYSLSWARVYENGELIYSYWPKEGTTKYNTPVSVFHLAELKGSDTEKSVHIEIASTMKGPAQYPKIYIGDEGQLVWEAFLFSLPKVIPAMLLFIFAICVLFLSFSAGIKSAGTRVRQMRSFVILMADISIWAFLETRISQFFFHNYTQSSTVILITYFLIPILFARFIESIELFTEKLLFKTLKFAAWLQFVVSSICVLAGINTVDLQILTQIIALLLLLYLAWALFYGRKTVTNTHFDTLYMCFFWVPLGIVCEIVYFFTISRMQSGFFIVTSLLFFTAHYAYLTIKKIFNDSIETVKNEERLKGELEHEKTRSMMVQMHPHFLYNALTSIQTIVKINPDYAYDLLYDFSVHLRGVIKSISVWTVSFQEEIKNVKAYLNIEKMRFGEKLKCGFDISYSNFDVIPLSVQPLVENSVKHGIFPKGEKGGTITIKSYEEEECYVVQVIDDGVGFDPSEYLRDDYSGESVGINNLVYRLKEMIGAELEYNSVIGRGTTATIRFKK